RLVDFDVQQPRRALTDLLQLADAVMIEPQHQAEAPAQGAAHQPLPRGRADRCEFRDRNRVRARPRPGPDQDIYAKVFDGRVQHFLDIREQAMDLVDEEYLPQLDVAQDAGEIQLLLQNWSGGLLEFDS